MATPDSTQGLDNVPVDEVPRDTLFKLLEPLSVDEEVRGQTGEYVLVPSTDKFPLQMRILFDAMRQRYPEAAYVTLRTRNLITLLYIIPNLHDGPGQTFSSSRGETMPATPVPVRNIAPSPITAEAVMPVTSKAGELPKNQPIVLVASYGCVGSPKGAIRLIRIEETEKNDAPAFSGNPMSGWLTESLYLRRGISFILVEQDGRLVLRKWGSEKDSMVIDPDCELEVCIPEDGEE